MPNFKRATWRRELRAVGPDPRGVDVDDRSESDDAEAMRREQRLAAENADLRVELDRYRADAQPLRGGWLVAYRAMGALTWLAIAVVVFIVAGFILFAMAFSGH